MWICKNCNEENEEDFDACWNCEAQTDDKPSSTYNESEKINNEIKISLNKSCLPEYTSSYETTRIIAKIVSCIGWIVLIISALIFFVTIKEVLKSRSGLELIGLLPAFSGLFSGLLLVMLGQLTRAVADNTDNTSKILSIIKIIAKKE